MNIRSDLHHADLPLGHLAATARYRFVPDEGPGDPARPPPRSGLSTVGREDLPYKVELWDESRTSVEQVLAVTANGSIGYAAYYAATREFPDRYVTFRHKNRIVSRSNPPRH
ncbi:hypothetical protein [Bradyrhizobium sp.]|uniref:hypothetical protein n=1 Tax=Bradyrhizobium sp. TaxID=376 RepID=UPI0025BC89C8|nr:hypothetical protein [Bradyrhizobium sp.]MBV8920418.1 hypothetical protein [Bradyrhizobium sp.]